MNIKSILREEVRRVLKEEFTPNNYPPFEEAQPINTDGNLWDELRERLYSGIAYFTYTKRDGSIRNAVGTLKPQFLEQLVGPRAADDVEASNRNEHLINYFDLDSGGWRRFYVDSLNSILEPPSPVEDDATAGGPDADITPFSLEGFGLMRNIGRR